MFKRINILVSAVLFSLLFGFQNCSKVRFSSDNPSLKSLAVPFGAIQINNGDSYTNDVNVVLSLNATHATEMYITSDAGCKSGGQWQNLVTTENWTLPANNKEIFVYAKFRNDESNESACVQAAIVHDDIPPTIVVDVPVPALTNVNAVNTVVYAVDSGSGVKEFNCVLPSEYITVPCSGTYSASDMDDGTHAIQYVAIDNAGNSSAPLAQTFIIDTTPPTVVLNQKPATYSGTTQATFGFTATDILSGVQGFECQLDMQAYVVCSSGVTYPGLTQGLHSFSVRSIDNAGNVSESASYSWTVDTAQPVIQFTQTPPAITNNISAPFAFEGKDQFGQTITQFECRLNSGTFQSCTIPLVADGVSGPNTFRVRGRNSAGIYSAEISYSWLIDTLAPTILVQGPAALTNSTSAQFTLTVNDTLSGIALVTCSLDGGAAQNCSSYSKSYSNLTPNMEHTFQAFATDEAGNTVASAVYKWTIDTIAPTLQISGPSSLTAQTKATLQILATDDHLPITYQCRLDSAAFAACSATKTYENLSDGVHTFYAQATDAAGNKSEIRSYAWNVVTVGPVITFTKTPAASIKDTEQGVLSYTITDVNSTVTSSTCKLNSSNMTCSVSGATITFPKLTVGQYTFELTATNALGITSARSYSFVVTACDVTEFGNVCTGEPPSQLPPGARGYFYKIIPTLNPNASAAAVGQYANKKVSANMGMINASSVIPQLTLSTSTINVALQRWETGFPGFSQLTEWFGLCYEASITVPQGAEYTIVSGADDALAVWINGHLVGQNNYGVVTETLVENYGRGSGPQAVAFKPISLAAGTHSVLVKFYQGWPVELKAQVWMLGAGVKFTSQAQLVNANLMKLDNPVDNAPMTCPR